MRASLYAWAVAETQHGRSPLPIGELLRATTPADLKALARLSEKPIDLTLPDRSGD
jgi:hypothetical protein